MAKQKQVSINSIDKIIADFCGGTKSQENVVTFETKQGNVDIVVKDLISLEEMHDLVQAVTGAMFQEDTYIPSVYQAVVAKAILAYYTNVKIDMKTDKLNQVIHQTNIISRIKEKINSSQLEDVYQAINDAIDFKKQEILSKQKHLLEKNINQLEALTNTMVEFGEKTKNINLDEFLENYKKIANTPDSERVNNILEFQNKIEGVK